MFTSNPNGVIYAHTAATAAAKTEGNNMNAAHWEALEQSWNEYAETERAEAGWEAYNAQWSYEAELKAEHDDPYAYCEDEEPAEVAAPKSDAELLAEFPF